MTPAYLNSPTSPFPFIELKEDQQLQFFIPPHQASSSFSSPIFFNITHDQRANDPREAQKNQQKEDKNILHGGSSDHQVIPSSSVQPTVESTKMGHGLSICELANEAEAKRDNESAKWMSSKMRLMQEKMNTDCTGTDRQERIKQQKFHDQEQDKSGTNSPSNSNNIIRICSDCNTTKTPLWRSGPQGPKSLCNACGIRQRKARRAMAAAAAGMVLAADNSTRTKVHNKEKKSRTSYMAQYKKPFKLLGPPQNREKISFEDFALSMSKNSALRRAFPKDEEEAAILLMALSCGLLHS